MYLFSCVSDQNKNVISKQWSHWYYSWGWGWRKISEQKTKRRSKLVFKKYCKQMEIKGIWIHVGILLFYSNSCSGTNCLSHIRHSSSCTQRAFCTHPRYNYHFPLFPLPAGKCRFLKVLPGMGGWPLVKLWCYSLQCLLPLFLLILVSLVQYFSLECHLSPWLYCLVWACECSIHNPVPWL